MDNFDLGKAKLVGIIAIILFIFIMVIANAYQYLPSESKDIPDINTEVNTTAQPDETTAEEKYTSDENTANDETNYKEDPSDYNVARETYSSDRLTPLENVSYDSDENISNTQDKGYDETFANAGTLKEQKQLVKAIDEYKKAYSLAETTKQKAECYEEIANIYALTKKYGTALSFAQKAYNLAPSTNREILLARLYFKTGSTDKASERINNVLRRDFSMDN